MTAHDLVPFLSSMAIGLLIGLERERNPCRHAAEPQRRDQRLEGDGETVVRRDEDALPTEWPEERIHPQLASEDVVDHRLERTVELEFAVAVVGVAPAVLPHTAVGAFENLHAPPGGMNALERCAGERAGGVPLHDCRRVVSDDAGNRKLTKRLATGRIDGMVALAMAIGAGSAEREVEQVRKPQYQTFVLGRPSDRGDMPFLRGGVARLT